MYSLEPISLKEPEDVIVAKMTEQFTTVGFANICDIDGWNEQEQFELMKEFHSLPEAVKEQLHMHHHRAENKNQYRGMAPFCPNDPSHKELFDMGMPWHLVSEEVKAKKYKIVEETPFPQGYEKLREGYEKYWMLFHNLSLQLIGYLALGLGKPRDFFDPWFRQDALSTLRSIYYLPRSHEQAQKCDLLDSEEVKLVTPAHTDTVFMTLLTTFGFPGLQVEIDGEYRSIKPEKNCLVVNLGESFSRVTNFKMKATMHRVLDIGEVRYSSPFFMEPRYEAVIPSNMLLPDEEQTEEPIVYGPWIMETLVKKYVEW